MGFVKVAETAELEPGQGMVVEAQGRELALFNIGGAFYCIDNECPHRGGPLGEGWLEEDAVYCPWHAWPINVRTGEVLYSLGDCVATYSCKVESGAVYVEVN
jgi:nitrite reductase/ring-hydroxylating ferredoxin subunit